MTAFVDAAEREALPHVDKITITPASKQPTRQIIHLLDWHFVHRAGFAADMQTQAEAAGKPLSEDDIHLEWQSLLAEVEAVQAQQMELLKELIKSHGLKTVFIERIAEAEMGNYPELAELMKNWKEASGNDPTDDFMRQLNREDRLMLGAASQVHGLQVRGADDAEALKATGPVQGRPCDRI